jgi:hypothetical protein
MTALRYVIAAILLAHGIAHLPGFAVPWRLMTSPEMPYTTTILSGRWDVGTIGIRVVGVAWLAASLIFVVAGVAYARNAPSSVPLIASIAVASLILSVLNWPQARVGVFINVALLVALPLIGQVSWRNASAARVRALSASLDTASGTVSKADFQSLPAPVARFLSRSFTNDQPAVTSASVEQTGEFRVGGSWYPFSAAQQFTIDPAGFVWDARIAMSTVMPVFVRDSYVAGSATMSGELAGVYPLVNQSDRLELDSGALQRFLAEAVWFPTALRPRPNLKWEPVDDGTARATLTDHHTSVSLEFRFNGDGDIAEIYAPDRFAENHGRYQPKPWLVRCSAYEIHEGMRIPVVCDVSWLESTGPEPYWRGRITRATYQF